MLVPSATLLAALVGVCPKVWVVDMSTLPVSSPAEYRFTVHFDSAKVKGGLTYIAYEGATPAELQSTVYTATFRRKGWEVENQDLAVVFRAVDGEPARRIWVEGDGPKPAVRWEFAPPKKK